MHRDYQKEKKNTEKEFKNTTRIISQYKIIVYLFSSFARRKTRRALCVQKSAMMKSLTLTEAEGKKKIFKMIFFSPLHRMQFFARALTRCNSKTN